MEKNEIKNLWPDIDVKKDPYQKQSMLFIFPNGGYRHNYMSGGFSKTSGPIFRPCDIKIAKKIHKKLTKLLGDDKDV